MGRYILKRIWHGAIVILGVTVIVFVVTRMVGDPVKVMLPLEATQEHGQWQLFENNLHGRAVLPQRIAEIKPGNVSHEIDKLNRNGPVQAKTFFKRRTLFKGCFQWQHHFYRITHQPRNHKHDDGDPENNDGAMPESFKDVPAHKRA